MVGQTDVRGLGRAAILGMGRGWDLLMLDDASQRATRVGLLNQLGAKARKFRFAYRSRFF
jgi:hypothetical protein